MRKLQGLVAVGVVVGLAACSSSGGGSKGSASSTTGAAQAATTSARTCVTPKAQPPAVTPVEGVAGDFTMTSFDGSQIRLHWYPIEGKAPVVLNGPGWGQAGATEDSGSGLFGDTPIGRLHQEGYHVLTWDPRGFGKSTGTITVDAPDKEGRDVRRMLDWLATQPEVQLDAPGDPRAGMVGGSYGGGIQLVTAATDCRVDAIVPTIAWHSLATSLDKSDTVKIGWSNTLYGAAAGRDLDPHITAAYQEGQANGVISPENQAWFTSRGPGDLVKRITAPTLFIQGTVDTLFTLDEAISNYEILRAKGTPTGMLWYCGGHGVCLTDGGDPARTTDATATWLRRYLKGEQSVDTGERVELIDQHGERYTRPDWPVAAAPPLRATGSGTLALTAEGGAGPVTAPPGSKNPVDAVAAGITPARAANAVNVPITTGRVALAVGAPRLTITYSGTSPAGDRPTRVFAQLVDDTTGLVLGNQITPVPVVLDGRPHTLSIPLEVVSYLFSGADDSVTLQITPTTVAYAQPRLGGEIEFSRIGIVLPTANGVG